MSYCRSYLKICELLPEKKYIYHVPFTGNTDGYDDVNCYKTTIDVYKIMYRQMPPYTIWPPAPDRFHPDNFTCVFINLIRLSGMYLAYKGGAFTLPDYDKLHERDRRSPGSPGSTADLNANKKHKKKKGSDGVLFDYGGPLYVDTPYYFYYGSPNLGDNMWMGFHDGISALSDISFSGILDIGD